MKDTRKRKLKMSEFISKLFEGAYNILTALSEYKLGTIQVLCNTMWPLSRPPAPPPALYRIILGRI